MNQEPVYYIYRHIRLDKGVPFYIGRGMVNFSGKSVKRRFWRAFGKTNRNKIWLGMVKKFEYEVEIIYQSYDLTEIKNKEEEFIRMYGRIDLGTGSLANLTFGNEAFVYSAKQSEEEKEISNKNKSINNFLRGKTGDLHPQSIENFVYDKFGNFLMRFGGIRECARYLGVAATTISCILNEEKPNKFCHGHYIFRKYQGEKIDPPRPGQKRREVLMLDKNMNLIREFSSCADAGRFIGKDEKSVWAICEKETMPKNGIIFRFK